MEAELGASIYTIRKDLPVMILDFCPHFIAVANFIWCNSFAMKISAYLIFVIFFTQTKILDRKFYTEERVNYDKPISRQNSVNCEILAKAMPACAS